MNSIRIICQNVFPGVEYKECEINNNTIQLYMQNTNNTKTQKNNIKELFKEETIAYKYLEFFYILQWVFSLLEVIILFILIKFLFLPKDINHRR